MKKLCFVLVALLFFSSPIFAQSNAGLDSTLRWGYSGPIDVATQVDGIEIRFVTSLGDVVDDRVASVITAHPLNPDANGKYAIRLGDHFAQVANGTYDVYIRNWNKGNRSPWAGPLSVSWSTDVPPTPDVPEIAERGSALLSWSAPTENEDGTPLTDLAGYRVYHLRDGADQSAADCKIVSAQQVDTGNVLQYNYTGLEPGLHWFWVTALDASGNESICSNHVSKQI